MESVGEKRQTLSGCTFSGAIADLSAPQIQPGQLNQSSQGGRFCDWGVVKV
ncbi:hypothetical protein [Gloeocapsopsis sp. IPPAS B-1203]|uniref:hypothetical protein n=1 Tax=Gloeocapsopsis sp. IPPAS B-1203 TaxID=2049454 RepID=UPI0025A0F6DF|nr:hypothetical protein [Gloeocapsopsis sp. IPPAS B-1203]